MGEPSRDKADSPAPCRSPHLTPPRWPHHTSRSLPSRIPHSALHLASFSLDCTQAAHNTCAHMLSTTPHTVTPAPAPAPHAPSHLSPSLTFPFKVENDLSFLAAELHTLLLRRKPCRAKTMFGLMVETGGKQGKFSLGGRIRGRTGNLSTKTLQKNCSQKNNS